MDYFTILAQRKQMADDFAGKRLAILRRYGPYSVFLGFDGDKALKLSAKPDMPFLHRIERRFIPAKKAVDWFPKKVAGTVLESIDITRGDRVLTFAFGCGYRLVFELTGRHANIIMVDSNGIVAGAVRKVSGRQSGVREITSGAPYQPPPARDYPDLLWSPLQALSERIKDTGSDDTLEQVLAVQLAAGSRLFAREALARAGFDGGLPATTVGEDTLFSLLKAAAALERLIGEGGEGATIVRGKDGLPRDVFPVGMMSASPGDSVVDDLDEAVRLYSMDRERGLDRKQLTQSVLASLNREEQTLTRTAKKIIRERGESAEPEKYEHMGNTLLSNLHVVHKGMETVTLPDVYGEGDIEITLDPTLDGPANAERLFARSRKLKEADRRAGERIADIEQRIAEIRREREKLDEIDDLKDLRNLAATHERRGGGRGGNDEDQPFPRRFTSISGLEIIVGRHDKENDELLKWARRNDLWLHAQGVGGSHVILRTPGKNQQPDHRSIEQAAAVAAYYSKSKTSAVVPVACTLLKYVVKRRGQGPGQVTYTREKVIFVEPGLP